MPSANARSSWRTSRLVRSLRRPNKPRRISRKLSLRNSLSSRRKKSLRKRRRKMISLKMKKSLTSRNPLNTRLNHLASKKRRISSPRNLMNMIMVMS